MRGLTRNVLFAILSTGLVSNAVGADDGDAYGWIEKTRIEPLGAIAKAKLDSGALTSSIHAKEIERFERDGEDWVRFTLTLEDEESGDKVAEEIERPVYRDLTVRGAGGKEERPVVLLELCLGRTIYEEQFSLNDRSDMIYPVLLGRRTIQRLGTIDVTRTFMNSPECDDDSPTKAFDEQETDSDIGA